jgi:hypothetical protein
MNQETKDRIDDEEAEYYAKREDELSHYFMSRAKMHERIQREIDDIRRKRNED